MLDKSSLQSLSHDEMDILRRYFYLVVPPVLMLEILGDLKKKPSGKRGEPSVAGLARKIVPAASLPVLPNFQELIKAELSGINVKMDHRPLVFEGRGIRAESGERGTELPLQSEAQALMKWQQGQFDEAEKLLAERYRQSLKSMDVEALQLALRNEYRQNLNLETRDEVGEFVDDLIACAAPRPMLQWFLNDAFGNDNLLGEVLRKLDGRHLESRFPYLTFCLRVSLIFHYGLAFGHVTTRVSNRIDFEYFYYLPFTLGFSSGDILHRNFFDIVRMDGNDFVLQAELKEDFQRILNEEAENPTSAEMVHPPELVKDSFTFRMWKKHMTPSTEKREALRKKLSPENEKRLMDHVKMLMSGSEDSQGPPDEERGFLFRHNDVNLDGPCICGSQKSFGECHGKQQSDS